MSSRSHRVVRSARPLLLAVVGVVGTGCGPAVEHPAAPAGYDITRIDAVANDFPPGFAVTTGLAKTLDDEAIRHAGIHVLTEATLDPPQCLAAIVPPYADLTAGTVAAGVTANGARGGIHVIALRLPQPVTADPPPSGCDRVQVTSAKMTGTAHRITVPAIEGVPTTGVKLIESAKDDDYVFTDGADHLIDDDPDYLLTAAVDDRTVIVIRGAVDDALNPPQVFSDLLVKAVAAVRGRR